MNPAWIRCRARSVAVAALLATMGVAASAAAFQALPYESPAVALDCDGSVEALAVGDVDGDGLDDFVTRRFHGGNLPHDEVVVQFGMTAGIGPRRSVVELPLSTSLELVLADFDGDDGKEVALFSPCSDCPGSTNVRIWGCAPDRTFTLEATVPAVFLPWGNNVLSHTGLASGDFDDDGDLDLVAGQIGGVAIHRNDGGWAFTHAASIPFPDSRILSGDFDGNGRPDIVGQPDTGGELRLALFSGAGFSFQVHTTTVPGTVGIDVAAGDLDGDGADEIVRLASPNGRVDVWSGTGGLVPRATMPSTSGTTAVSVGDVDGDGLRDLAVAAGPTHRFAWYVNEGNFAFAVAQSREAGGPPSDLAWSDVDFDGRLDPIVANTSGVGIVAYPSAGTVTGLSSSHATAADPTVVSTGDVDGDGRRDFASLSSAANVVTLRRTAPDFKTWIRTDVPIELVARDMILADLDLDGDADLVTVHAGSPARVIVRLADGAGGFAGPSELTAPPGPLAVKAADLDLDGAPDLLVLSGAASTLRAYRGDGAGQFVAQPDIAIAPWATGLLVHQLDDEGRPDVVVTSVTSSGFTLLRGLPGPGIAFAADEPRGVAGGVGPVELLDADNDGRLDLAFGGTSGGGPLVLAGLGNGLFGAPVAFGASDFIRSLRAADVDGDHHADLIALSYAPSASSGAGAVHFLRGNGDGTFAPSVAFLTPEVPQNLALADVTGDGRVDVLVSSLIDDAVELVPNLSTGPVGVPTPSAVGRGVALSIAPSPAVGPLRVSFAGRPHAPVRLEVFGVDGRRVGAGHDVVADADGRASLVLASPGRAGVYLVRASQGEHVAVKRAVVLE
jgi:hypothetical protein